MNSAKFQSALDNHNPLQDDVRRICRMAVLRRPFQPQTP